MDRCLHAMSAEEIAKAELLTHKYADKYYPHRVSGNAVSKRFLVVRKVLLSVLGKSVRKEHFTVYRKALTSHPDHSIELWRSL